MIDPAQPISTLNDGRTLPQLGFGVFKVAAAEAERTVLTAIDAGYRAIDTAAIYRNEEGVGAALAASDQPVAITTKLWNDAHEPAAARAALDESLRRLGRRSVDLYLVHWPVPSSDFVATWRAMIGFRDAGLAGSIGVSNFTVAQLEAIIAATGVVPAVNQIELHPGFPQAELRAFHEAHGIVTESWSPLGQGKILGDPRLAEIAAKHGKTPAQVVLRWHVDLGLVVIPKSVTPARIRENFDIFDFSLDADDLAKIATMENGERIGGDPATANYGV